MRLSIVRVLLVMILASCLPGMARAAFSVNFIRITDNNGGIDLGSQLELTILSHTEANATYGLSLTSTEVLFAFTNNVGTASNISEIYLDDGSVVGLNSVHNSLGGFTNFNDNGSANPGNLPGGNNIDPAFVATAGFSADTNPGPPTNGIDQAADILGIAYEITAQGAGSAFDKVVASIQNGDLRIGLHVRSIGAPGGSDSYVNDGGPDFLFVPVPASAVLVVGALGSFGLFGGIRRRLRSRKDKSV